MAYEPKTKPTGASVSDFLAAVDNPRRRADGEAVCALMAEVSGDAPVMWGPSIVGFGAYQSPTGPWPIIGFSPRKAKLVLYINRSFEGADALVSGLGAVAASKACLYVGALDKVDVLALRELAAASVASMRERYPAA